MTPYAYIIALLPLFAFLMIVFFLRWKEQVSSLFSISMIVLGWVLSLIVFFETLARNRAP